MKTIAKSALIVSFFFGVDKILSFIRQLLVARQFELSYELDVFNAANNIPDLLSALISGGAMAVALIPVLSDYFQSRGHDEGWKLFSYIINFAFLVTGVIALVIFFITPWFISTIIAPGFPPQQTILAIELMRLDLIAIIIFSISGIVMSGLQANQHFLLPAAAPGLYNIGQIFGVAVLAPAEGISLGPLTLPAFNLGIHGLVYGVIIGSLLHLLIQIPALIKYRYRWTPGLGLKTEGVQQVFSLLGPRVITMFFIQMFFIVRDNLASGMNEGAISALNLGWFIMQVPETLFGTAIAIALLPTISASFAQGQHHDYTQAINAALRGILTLTIPTAALLSIGLTPLVQFAFGYDEAGTQLVVLAARIYLAGMTGHAILEIASRAYYAKKNAKIPLFAATLNAIGYLILASWLSKTLGFAGIALANSIVFTIEALILIWLLNRAHPGILALKRSIIKLCLSTAAYSTLFITLNRQFESIPALYRSLGGMSLGMIVTGLVMLPELKDFFQQQSPPGLISE